MKIVQRLSLLAVLSFVFGFVYTSTQVGIARAFGPSVDPVRYTWQVKKAHVQVRKCEVWYPDNRKVACSNFEQSALNEFPLEYTNPYQRGKQM